MPFTDQIDRTGADALIPETVANSIIKQLEDSSAARAMFLQARMSSKSHRMPILDSLPTAYFVNGDQGMKETTAMKWANKFMTAEEIAVIIPIPEAVLDDAEYDIWGEVQPKAVEAIGRKLDEAVFFGVDKPASWPTDVLAGATATGNSFTMASAAAAGAIFGDLDETVSLIEDDGCDASGWVADRRLRKYFRRARNADGDRLDLARVSPDFSTLDGDQIRYAMRGQWGAEATGEALAFTGDWSNFILGIRQDITVKLLDQAVITDNAVPPNIILNLPQQDSVALRLVFRCGFQVANPLTHERPADQATEAGTPTRYPAGVLVHA